MTKLLSIFVLILLILVSNEVVFSKVDDSPSIPTPTPTPENIYNCSAMEEPIVGDWGFYKIKNDDASSPWETYGSIVFCADSDCGSSAYSLAGYYYALFQVNSVNASGTSPPQVSLLSQIITLPSIDDDDGSYYLEYFLSSQFETNISPELKVLVDDKPVATYNGNLLLGDLERVTLPYSQSQQLNITFQTTYINVQPGSDSLSNGFRIGSVIIRKSTVSTSPTLYVDVINGSDKFGSGNQTSPYSTIQQALTTLSDNGTIYLADGVYCNLASYLPISHSVNMLSISGDPTKVTLCGESQLNLFKISYSNQPQELMFTSKRRNSYSNSLISMESIFDVSSNVITASTSSSSSSSSSSVPSSDSSSDSGEPIGNGISITVDGITIKDAVSSTNSPGGAALFIEGNVKAYFSNCHFKNNSDSQSRGAISARGNAVLTLVNCVVYNCSFSENAGFGPAISMLGFGGTPTISLIGCYLNNQYNVLVDETDYFHMSDTEVVGISPPNSNSLCSIMLSRTHSSFINNCSISDINIGALCIISSVSNVSNTIFIRNGLETSPGGNIYISQGSTVYINGVTIRDSESSIGAAIFAMELSTVVITNSTITNVTATSSLISSSDSNLSFESSVIDNTNNLYTLYLFFGEFEFSDSTISNSEGAFYATQTNIVIQDSIFVNTTASSHVFQDCTVNIIGSKFIRQYGFFYSSFSTINITDSLVRYSLSTFLMISPLSNVFIGGSNFSNNKQNIISLLSQSTLTVSDSQFVDNIMNSTDSSVAVLMQYEGSNSIFTNVVFQNNQSPLSSGGCIFTYSGVKLTNCTAIYNFAAKGGVIATSIDGSLITFEGGNYTLNSATGGGGVIYYSGNEPIGWKTAVMVNNTASYGDVLATDASSIRLAVPFPENFEVEQLYNGTIYITDGKDQIVSGIEIKIFLQISGNTIDSTSTTHGIANFINTKLLGPINSTVDVEFLSNNPNLPPNRTVSTVAPCPPGYIPSTTKIQCTVCRRNSYGYNGKTCVQCPPIHAVCKDGTNVTVLPGWWYDVNEHPYELYQCPNSNCLGGLPSNCAPHSSGVLCAQCDPGFYDWGDGCKRCDKTSPILFIAIVVVSIGMIILVQSSDSESGLMTVIIYFAQTLMVLSNGVRFNFLALLNLEFQPTSSGSSSIFGICPGPFDYYQQHYFTLLSAPWLILVLLISTVVFYMVYKYKLVHRLKSKITKDNEDFEKNKSVSNYSSIIISDQPKTINNSLLNSKSLEKQSLLNQKEELEDTEDSNGDVTDNETNESKDTNGYIVIADSKNTTLSKSIDHSFSNSLSSQMTIIDSAIAAPNNQTFLSQQLGAFIKLMLNIYTPIGKATFEIFFCETVGVSAYVLIANNGVSCTDEQYRKALIVSYSLLSVIIGFPLILMVLLFKNRKTLNDPHTQRTYGVFILKYKSSFYFWDVILLLRRLLIILMSTMDPTSAARSFLLVVVSLVSVLLQLKYQPFKRISDNRLELTSLSLLFICCVYLDNTVYQSIEQWIVIASSIIFLVHACYILYSNYRFQIIDQLQHYLYVITRGKKGRKNTNNSLFGSNSYFLYNQDHIYNDDDFSHNGIFSRKDKKIKKPNKKVVNNNSNNDSDKVKEIENIVDNETENENNNNNNIEELNNNYYDDSDDYLDEDSSSSDSEDDNNNNESTGLLKV